MRAGAYIRTSNAAENNLATHHALLLPSFCHSDRQCGDLVCVRERDSEAGCQLAHITPATRAELFRFNLNIVFSYPKTFFSLHDFERKKSLPLDRILSLFD